MAEAEEPPLWEAVARDLDRAERLVQEIWDIADGYSKLVDLIESRDTPMAGLDALVDSILEVKIASNRALQGAQKMITATACLHIERTS